MAEVLRMPPGSMPRIGGPSPSPKCGRCDPYRVTVGKHPLMTILSRQVFVVWTHYVPPVVAGMKGRCQPCTGEHGACWCDHKKRGEPRWAGWIAVQVGADPKPRLVQLTPAAARCDKRFDRVDYNLRGHQLELVRLSDHYSAEMEATLLPRVPRGTKLKPEPYMSAVVLRMYEAADRPEGVPPIAHCGNVSQRFQHGPRDEGK